MGIKKQRRKGAIGHFFLEGRLETSPILKTRFQGVALFRKVYYPIQSQGLRVRWLWCPHYPFPFSPRNEFEVRQVKFEHNWVFFMSPSFKEKWEKTPRVGPNLAQLATCYLPCQNGCCAWFNIGIVVK